MTILVRPTLPGEIESVGRNASEDWVRDGFVNDKFRGEFDRPYSTLLLIDDVPIIAGGFFDRGSGLAMAWLLVSRAIEPHHLFAVVRACRRVMQSTPFKVIEAHCLGAYPQSHRLVRAIGFEPVAGECLTSDGRPFSRFIFRN